MLELLKSINREGIDKLISFLEKTDFFEAPASTRFHGSYAGGLVEHSIKVYEILCEKVKNSEYEFDPDTLKISALLHDICKLNYYKVDYRNAKNKNGEWEKVPYYTVDDTIPYGHGEKSVIMLQNIGLRLSIEEMLAIRYHMGAWDGALLTNDVKYAYNKALDECPLIVLLQNADNTSSLIFENKTN